MALVIKKFLKINGLAGFIEGKFWVGLCIRWIRDAPFLLSGYAIRYYNLYNPVRFVNGCCLVIDEIKVGWYYQYPIVCSTLIENCWGFASSVGVYCGMACLYCAFCLAAVWCSIWLRYEENTDDPVACWRKRLYPQLPKPLYYAEAG
jgi:hypothetical protein